MISTGKKILAEFLGTFLLVFFGAGAVVVTILMTHGAATPNSFNIGLSMADWLGINIVFGLVLAVGIYAFGRISGAHFNPAVTIGLWSVKKFPGRDVAPYIVAQLLGAVVASLLFAFCLGAASVTVAKLGATAPFTGVGYLQAIVVEIIGTFVLVLAIMAVAVDKRATPGFAGLIIGLTLTAVLTLISNITGGSVNPARTFGPYLADTFMGGANLWANFPIYIIGPVIGGILAAVVYQYMAGDQD
ncbi:MAG TPA: MIP/aquaporin family protein [Methanobacteriaceae archaeon]|nr:MIP/aquaporin family protein [Methanobacteriaceae archaeon]